MEKVSIQEASRRLNVPQAVIRRYAREGKLKAYREGGSQGNAWVVELPEDGWLDEDKQAYMALDEQISRWWWANKERTGQVHYVDDVGIEELQPHFLCGLESVDIGHAPDHEEEDRCPECVELATSQGLRM
jgi:excisionase family DNA binding protein